MDYDVIICFEVHAELGTRTKLFCGCPNRPDAPPNACVCPVCTGQPGALPVLNRKAVEYCVRAGLALHCDIRSDACFARKNYFYPDLPKGYQISQYERPFCEDGHLEITGDDGLPYAVGIKRIHLEEDAGKLVHSSDALDEADSSLVDYNRACVPLIEIVADHTRNPLRSVNEARTYLEKLRRVLRYIGVSDCSMEKGQFRCDVNVSLRPRGSREFGDRAEIKNMASFRFVSEAITFEVERQAELLRTGKPVLQETRLFDETRKRTLPMRGKEDAPDYRYFPDPDLVDVHLDRAYVEAVRGTLPELPDDRVTRLVREHRIPAEDAAVLTRDREVSDFFDQCVPHCDDAPRLGRWILKDLFKLLNAASLTMQACPVDPEAFARLVNLVSRGDVTERAGRIVLEEVFRKGRDPEAVVEEKGLRAIQDERVLEDVVAQVMEEHAEVVKKIQAGQQEPIHFLVGQVMKKTSGRAHAGRIREILHRNLGVEA